MTAAITDFSQFGALRRGAERNDPATLRAVAGQFEALFIASMLKNMRQASLGDPLFEQSDQYEMYRGLLDQQLSVEMASGRGIGLADMLVRQMGSDAGMPPGGVQVARTGELALSDTPGCRSCVAGAAPVAAGAASVAAGSFRLPAAREAAAPRPQPAWSSPEEFARDIWPYAERVAEKLKVAPAAILAQAALESGWGQHVMRRADGSSSLNLFGIKAGPEWQGPSTTRSTIEYAGGVARREQARFRAYPDIAATFDDYAELLGEHPRYAPVRNRGNDVSGFARALQEAGYATDPAYADKIAAVLHGNTMQKAINALKNLGKRPITGL